MQVIRPTEMLHEGVELRTAASEVSWTRGQADASHQYINPFLPPPLSLLSKHPLTSASLLYIYIYYTDPFATLLNICSVMHNPSLIYIYMHQVSCKSQLASKPHQPPESS